MAQAAMMDTHEEFTKLVEAGADEKLAEAVVKLHARAQVTDSVAKAEFNDFRKDVRLRFDKVEKEIVGVRTEIADVKSDLKWMKGIGAAILAAVVIPMLTELL